ncbi:MAG: hypothetical protein AAB383_02800 [Patescibacteria group bacterium]
MDNPRSDEDSTLPDEALMNYLDRNFPISTESRDRVLQASLAALDGLEGRTRGIVAKESGVEMIAYATREFRKMIEVVGASGTLQNIYPLRDEAWYENFPRPHGLSSNDLTMLDSLKGQYGDLPEDCRKFGGKVYPWEEFLDVKPGIQCDFLVAGSGLKKAAPFFINEKGCLVFGENGRKPDADTLNTNYIDNKIDAISAPGRNLITFQEFMRRVQTKLEWDPNVNTWMESGPIRHRVSVGHIYEGQAGRDLRAPTRKAMNLGALRVTRVPLHLPAAAQPV